MKQKKWTDSDLDYLKNNIYKLSFGAIASHLDRTYGSVEKKAKYLGIKRPSRQYKIGQKINRLEIIAKTTGPNPKRTYFILKCVCGKDTILDSCSIKNTQSCGCLRSEQMKAISLLNRLPDGETSHNRFFHSYTNRAKIKKLEFSITKEQFRDLTQKNCAYCNSEPKPYNIYISDGKIAESLAQDNIDRSWVKVNGVDRINSSIGYVLSNCVPCCSNCNYAKTDFSVEEFLDLVKKVYEFQKQKELINGR